MRTTFKLKYEKISKKKAIELFGKDRLDRYCSEAWERFCQDPEELQAWWTEHGMFEIHFRR